MAGVQAGEDGERGGQLLDVGAGERREEESVEHLPDRGHGGQSLGTHEDRRRGGDYAGGDGGN